MAYEALREALPGSGGVTVTALPDGSVDRYFRVRAGGGYLDTKAAFGERVAAGAESFRTDHRMTRPGGQAVNMADQADALGDDVTLCGHLDHAVFGPLGVETVSLGKPAIVQILGFRDGDLMLSEESDDILDWTLGTLTSVADLDDLFGADAVCWGNWVSLPGATDALRALPGRVEGGGTFVLDPGNVTDTEADRLDGLFDALGGLTDAFDVVVSADRGEVERMATVAAPDGVGSDPETLEAVRSRAGIDGVVLHEAEKSAVAHREGYVEVSKEARADDGGVGYVEVENFDAARVTRTAGAGDRYTAGLAHALANGWAWDVALALGNACASRYVETGETGTAAELAAYVDERT